MPTEYPANFKKEVINRYQNGESIKSLSHELHIAHGTLYRWRNEYCSIQWQNWNMKWKSAAFRSV